MKVDCRNATVLSLLSSAATSFHITTKSLQRDRIASSINCIHARASQFVFSTPGISPRQVQYPHHLRFYSLKKFHTRRNYQPTAAITTTIRHSQQKINNRFNSFALEGSTKSTTTLPIGGAGTKRRASSELLPIGQRGPTAAVENRNSLVNYGTSVFFNRAIATMSTSAVASQRSFSEQEQKRRSMVIRLTKQEAKICNVLDQVAKRYEADGGKKVQLRIAGGWVRDKLLGLSCHDLDIGVDTMMGYEFATLVNEYMASIGHQKRTIAKIATNPEKSKHLETATMVMMGIPLDFVNLRSEVYDDGSRIPSEITFGSPSEDAYRRDITINALFYNIHTHSVEDYTGKGLEDLKNGFIRTPLKAYETFWQDPLRVMRCIRFAARFQFRIAEDAKQAILDPRIKLALKTKISKERIGAELEKMIDDGAGRSTAIRLLRDLDLYDVVFAPPEVDNGVKGTSAVEGKICGVDDAFKLVWIIEWILKIHPRAVDKDEDGTIYLPERDYGQESLLKQTQGSTATSHLVPIVETEPTAGIPMLLTNEYPSHGKLAERTLILAGMLYPYRDMTATVNKKLMPAGAWIMRYGLKDRNVNIGIVTNLLENIKNVLEVVNSIASAEEPSVATEEMLRVQEERTQMGMLIRDIGFNAVVGKKWPSAFLLGLGVELIPKFDLLKQGNLDDEAMAVIAKYNTFLSKAAAYKIDHCFSWKCLVSGKELTQLLDIAPGPKVTGYLRTIIQWQLKHPEQSKEECQQWILEHKDLFQ